MPTAVSVYSKVKKAGFPPFKEHKIQGLFQELLRTFLGKFKDQNVQKNICLKINVIMHA